MRMKEWLSECECGFKGKILGWDTDFPLPCPQCNCNTVQIDDRPARTQMIATDDIPGGIEIRHGVCWPDGSPRRFYSKTEIKRAANEAGVTILGDTPKKYRV